VEFFTTVDRPLTAEELTRRLTVGVLPEVCDAFAVAEAEDDDQGAADTLWGHFRVVRTPIRGGVRFTLTDCPNALAWTVTAGYPPAPEGVVVHATIARTEADTDPDFADSIQEFVEAWQCGLEALPAG
jgi:hypothetical protein